MCRAQPVREGVVQFGRGRQRLPDGRAEEALRQPLGKRVDRQQPRQLRRQRRVEQGKPPARVHAAAGDIVAPRPELAQAVRLVEPFQAQRARGVRRLHAHERTTVEVGGRRLRAQAHAHGGKLPVPQRGDGRFRRIVLIIARQEAEQILDRAHAEL